MEPDALYQDIHQEAWAALAVNTMGLEGVDEILADSLSRQLIEAGISFGAGATVAYFRDRGWLDLEAIDGA